MQIVDEVFSRFGIRVCIKINNRKLLTGIAEIIGAADRIVDITVAIDKLDKIGLENVNKELLDGGLSAEQVEKLQPIILLEGTNEEKLETMCQVLAASEVGVKGVEEVAFVLDALKQSELKNTIELDLTLARGLNYYTGCIFEVTMLRIVILQMRMHLCVTLVLRHQSFGTEQYGKTVLLSAMKVELTRNICHTVLLTRQVIRLQDITSAR